MALPEGTRLGPSEILSPIGAGGMGEVYRAKDTRLDRTVAVKVLPSHLSGDTELRQRFEREAKAVSSLNHPHICTVYDVGQQDGTDFLVMEYLEGETLADRLTKGPLQTDQVLRYAIEVSDALDKAHRQGVVHRDLKPGNIMLTKSGAKLLDFGLAKLRDTHSGSGEAGVTGLPTQNGSLTGAGTILGTFQYMAPEQLEGKEADARTDIFGFGAVVYEMATGRKAFEGESQASLITAIMSSEPEPISALQPMTPPGLDHIVRRCLDKDPDNRFDTAHDVMLELQWIAEAGSQAGIRTPVVAHRKNRERIVWAIALLLVAVMASIATWNLKPQPLERSGHPARFAINPPETAPLFISPAYSDVAITPDGASVIYLGRTENQRALYLRRLDQLSGAAIVGTKGTTVSSPFLSPDGSEVAFRNGNELKKVSIHGGVAVALCTFPLEFGGGTWGEDGTIVFGSTKGNLFSVPAEGGDTLTLTTPDSGQLHMFPEILPASTAILFTILSGGSLENSQIAVLDRETGEYRVVISIGSNPHYLPTGHIVYGREGGLWSVAFDLNGLEVKGEPLPVVNNVIMKRSSAVSFSLSISGSLVYIPTASAGPLRTLVWVDRNGKEEPLDVEPRLYGQPRVSPDGNRLAVVVVDDSGNMDVWILDLVHNTPTRLTLDPFLDLTPLWTPDGKSVVFSSGREGPQDLYMKAADGTGQVEVLMASPNRLAPISWTPDGTTLVFNELMGTNTNIGLLSIGSERSRRLILQEKFDEVNGEISPDGRWIAYTSNESGQIEVYVRPFPKVNEGRWSISTAGGFWPKWDPDGEELFYLNGNKMMNVSIQTGPRFTHSSPRLLFEGRYLNALMGSQPYDINSKTGRFLMIKELKETEEASRPREIVLVQNWSEELKRLVPTDN